MKPVLENVCLCSIVRDEEMNPAGGIVDFLNCTLPYVGNAVVVDTGSADRTRDLLSDAQKAFPHLRVFDYQFDGYAQARNFSLEQARSKSLGEYALVLDADERFFGDDFEQLEKELGKKFLGFTKKPLGINFLLENIYPEVSRAGPIHNPRCFLLNEKYTYYNYENDCLEILIDDNAQPAQEVADYYRVRDSSIAIKHFMPSEISRREKTTWYEQFRNPQAQAQRNSPHFADWKKLNPRRAEYK